MNIRRVVIISVTTLISAVVFYLLFWPVPVSPVAWEAPEFKGYVGIHAPNTGLSNVNVASMGEFREPEQIGIGPDGMLYTGVRGGKVLRMNQDMSDIEVFADTHGRVLGFAFDTAGNMIAADAMQGLISINPNGRITLLSDEVNGSKYLYPDAVAIAPNGKIYLTDASTRFPAKKWGSDLANMLDMMEQSATGRIIEFDPATQSTRILAHGLSFPNGMLVSNDQKYLFVAETARYRIWKISLAADNLDVNTPSDKATLLLENLPGFPDNLTRGLDGRIWVGFPGPRDNSLDNTSPFMRKLLLRLPDSFMPAPVRHGHVLAFTEEGKIVADLQDTTGKVAETTGVTETKDRIYIHHIDELPGIPWLEASELKIK
ncbi:MAG: SMP-30/gluconolactonase/LRE family protein [Chitinophagaceae bacterium]|nr:SMP-30/gluconolactonase/LRE family protein [Chitinophagaceae bacterium]MCW5925664.1 SMP-30/gluconolactonase/LRE family protein [Chitinophagaceae bacterium]